jgi:hypothetical protein
MADRRPVCGSCERGIRPCAPCCRHGGWVHRHSDAHECDNAGTVAYPFRVLAEWERALPAPGTT